MEENKITLNKPLPSPFELLKEAWKLYGKKLSLLLAVMAVPTVIVLLCVFILPPIAGIVNGIIRVLTDIALIYAVLSTSVNPNQTYDLYQKAFGKFLPFLWVTILVGLAIVGGTILLIIPGIIFAVWFGFATYVFLIEGVGGTAALSKSKKYVEGRWWSIFGRGLFIIIVIAIINALFSLATVSLPFTKVQDQILGTIIGSFFSAPLQVAYTYLLYKYAKTSK